MEKLVTEQLQDYFDINDTVAQYRSGFSNQYSSVTAETKVANDIVESLEDRKYFDTVDHDTLLDGLLDIPVSSQAIGSEIIGHPEPTCLFCRVFSSFCF